MSRLGLVVFDMDGVILRETSSWQIIHESFKVDSLQNLKLYLEGEISYREFMERDVELWKKSFNREITRELLTSILRGKLEFNLGVFEAVEWLKSRGLKLAIVTCGLDLIGKIVSDKLRIENFLGNSLEFNDNGVLVGAGEVRVPLLDKDLVLKIYAKSLGYDCSREVAYIGDSVFDIPVFKRVALSIAYSKDEQVASHAHKSFYGDMKKLIDILKPYL